MEGGGSHAVLCDVDTTPRFGAMSTIRGNSSAHARVLDFGCRVYSVIVRHVSGCLIGCRVYSVICRMKGFGFTGIGKRGFRD